MSVECVSVCDIMCGDCVFRGVCVRMILIVMTMIRMDDENEDVSDIYPPFLNS